MRVICDLEANGLEPTKIWVIVCKDIDTGKVFVFKHDYTVFREFASNVTLWVGHNFLGYDIHALHGILGISIDPSIVFDTLVLSRLYDSTIKGHSLEDWGARFGRPKLHADIKDWSVFTTEMEERCVSDVEINALLWKKVEPYTVSERWRAAVEIEHYIHYQTRILHTNGFAFDYDTAVKLKEKIDKETQVIDKALKAAFPPVVKLVREVTPRLTKHGTIAKNSIPKVLGSDYTSFTAEAPFSLIDYIPFNARSHQQRLDRLWQAGWKPVNKTKGHKDAEKTIRALKRLRIKTPRQRVELADLEASLGEYGVSGFGKYGWMTDEENLATLPDSAPEEFQQLARFLLLSNRSSTLETWFEAYDHTTKRIHGSFNHIEPWTQRMSHVRPNLGNIPKFDAKQPHKTPYSDQMRSLWTAGVDRYLVGVDAESIQLRIFGHYLNDANFINSLISGKKEDGTDPHSLNKNALGNVCKSRDDAKTFIYAWLLGAGIGRIASILSCSRDEAYEANENFIKFYPGLQYLKEEIIPYDASRGYFEGFDGRYVRIFGEDTNERKHYTLAGYLQNGEAVIMKHAARLWNDRLTREKILYWWVNFVHDEWQIETVRDQEVAEYVATVVADSIRLVGESLHLRCPMAGSILNSHGKVAIGDNWMQTH